MYRLAIDITSLNKLLDGLGLLFDALILICGYLITILIEIVPVKGVIPVTSIWLLAIAIVAISIRIIQEKQLIGRK